MKQIKAINFILLLFIGIHGFSQFSYPEMKIEKPQPHILYPENQINAVKSINKPLKKSIINKVTTEYDIDGKIIKESKKENLTTIVATFTYKNNVLTEKITTKTTDSDEVKRANKRSEIESRQQDVVAFYVDKHETETYRAVLDKKNNIVSYSTEFNTLDKEINKTEVRTLQTQIIYDKGNISEIKSGDISEKYFYDNNLLIKKVKLTPYSRQIRHNIEEYSYDKNNNLTVIKIIQKTTQDEAVLENFSYLKDSVVYDHKNRIIWAMQQNWAYKPKSNDNFSTYKYDDKDRITEIAEYQNSSLYSKNEYEYQNDVCSKIIINSFRKKTPETTTITYFYVNNLLKEFQIQNTENTILTKQIYDYDENQKILKITALKNIKQYQKNASEDAFNILEETTFMYNPNKLTILGKFNSSYYFFYE